MIKEVIINPNNTFTLKVDNWSVTASLFELNETWKKCYNKSIIQVLDGVIDLEKYLK